MQSKERFFDLATAKCFVTATTRRRDVMCASHTFTSFYVTHLAQPNNSSRRRVVAVTKTSSEAAFCLM